MVRDPLEGRMLDLAFLTKCVDKVKSAGKYKPEVLILSEADFHGHLMAIAAHGLNHHIVSSYTALGIKRLVWAEDVTDGEFLLSSGKGLSKGIQTLEFKPASSK